MYSPSRERGLVAFISRVSGVYPPSSLLTIHAVLQTTPGGTVSVSAL